MNEIIRFIDLLVTSAQEEHRISGEDASASLKLARATLIQAIERKLETEKGYKELWFHMIDVAECAGFKSITEAITKAKTQPKWLPIDSAPKDGIDIWLYDRQWSPDPQIGYWCYRLGSWLSDSGSKLNPTRWQPLPEPPKLKGEL